MAAAALRAIGRALWLTAWWGLPLVLASTVGARLLPWLPAVVVATWVSYAAHEGGHVGAAVRAGCARGEVRLRRRGPGLAVDVPQLPGRDAVLVALAGPVAGAVSGLLVAAALGGGAAGVVVVLLLHLPNALPLAPDGRALRRALRTP